MKRAKCGSQKDVLIPSSGHGEGTLYLCTNSMCKTMSRKFASDNMEDLTEMTTGSDEKHVKDLLAIIHRDGGHHTLKVGYSQSITDAEVVVTQLREKLGRAEFNLQQERDWNQKEWDRHSCYPRDGND